MNNLPQILKPPEIVRGITKLDKQLFNKSIDVCYVHLQNVKISTILPQIKKFLLKMLNFKPVENIEQNNFNVYLNPELINDWTNCPNELTNVLKDLSVKQTDLKSKKYVLTYDNYSVEDTLKAILPTDKEGSSSFTKVGHIVHLNLREHLLPFKSVIGNVLLDKVKACRTVVNKVDSIDNTYRNFKMEILAGEDDTITTLKENQCLFKFDFSTVYWNSRLCTEHERIVKNIKSGDVLFDVFAGVGPFSIPAAKKKCFVYCNDLNVESYKWLNHNCSLNKIDPKYFQSCNKDGKDFILTEIKENLPKYLNTTNIHITMNLPASAVEFINLFVNLFDEGELPKIEKPPLVYVYCFAKGIDYENIAKTLILTNVGFDISEKIVEIFRVRTVSSLKEMMRVCIKLDEDILIHKKHAKRKIDHDDPLNKKSNNGQAT